MARIRTTVTTEGEIALSAATAKTVLQIVAPTNQQIAVTGFSVSFDGTSGAAEPVAVEILRQTTAGTMSSATVMRITPGSETLQMTAQKNASAEPTAGDILRRYDIHPQTGYEKDFPFDKEIIMTGGTRLGIRCTAPAGVNVIGSFDCEE